MSIESMEELFFEQIKDLYDAEERLVKALPSRVFPPRVSRFI